MTFHKLSVFSLKANVTRYLITHIQFQDVSNHLEENQTFRLLYNKTQLNMQQSAVCTPL